MGQAGRAAPIRLRPPFFDGIAGGSADYKAAGYVDRMVILSGRGEILSDLNSHELRLIPGAADTCRGIIGNAITAIEELMLINRNPEYFILEQSPLKARQTKKGRLTRSPDRSRYVPLKPDAIRKTMGLKQPGSQTNTKQPHERRRHWRHSLNLCPKNRFRYKISSVFIGVLATDRQVSGLSRQDIDTLQEILNNVKCCIEFFLRMCPYFVCRSVAHKPQVV